MRFEDIELFNSFINDTMLIDLSLVRNRFTWSWLDGSSLSRLDRFLLLSEWCNAWPNSFQQTLVGGVFNHCLIILNVDVAN